MAATAPRPRGSGRRPRSPRPPRAEERGSARSNGATWTLKNRGVHADCEQGTNRKEMKQMKGMKGIFGIKEMSFESWRFLFHFPQCVKQLGKSEVSMQFEPTTEL